jgi:hypothetical protein
VQLLFHLDQLVALALHHFRHRDPGRARHHLGDLLRADLGAQQLRFPRLRLLGELLLERRNLAVLDLRHRLPVALALRLLHLQLELLELLLHMLAARERGLLGLPLLLEVGVLLFQTPDLILDQRQALL